MGTTFSHNLLKVKLKVPTNMACVQAWLAFLRCADCLLKRSDGGSAREHEHLEENQRDQN